MHEENLRIRFAVGFTVGRGLEHSARGRAAALMDHDPATFSYAACIVVRGSQHAPPPPTPASPAAHARLCCQQVLQKNKNKCTRDSMTLTSFAAFPWGAASCAGCAGSWDEALGSAGCLGAFLILQEMQGGARRR